MTRFSRTLPFIAAVLTALPMRVAAQVYNGGGISAGLNAASGLGLASGNPFAIIINVIAAVLSIMAVVATATIIIAGIYLIISLGRDEQKEKAKKIIYYTLAGLIVILFARIIVGLVTNILYSAAR